MKLDKKLLKKIAANARLELTENEVKEFLPQLQEIFALFSKLDKIDTKNVKPSFQPIEVKNVLREDKVEKSLPVNEVFVGIKNKKGDYFKGPKAV